MISTLYASLIASIAWIVSCLFVVQLRDSINYPGITSLFYQIAIAYLVTFIFYFVTIFLPERKDRKNIDTYVIPRTLNVIGDAYSIFNELVKKVGVSDPGFPPSKDDLKNILERISLDTNDAPMIDYNSQRLNWLGYLNHTRIRSQNLIQKIFDRMPYLNTDLIRILTKIDDSGYFHSLGVVAQPQVNIQNTKLAVFTEGLFLYFEYIEELRVFMENNYNKSVSYKVLFGK